MNIKDTILYVIKVIEVLDLWPWIGFTFSLALLLKAFKVAARHHDVQPVYSDTGYDELSYSWQPGMKYRAKNPHKYRVNQKKSNHAQR